jgi:hypothetical protein
VMSGIASSSMPGRSEFSGVLSFSQERPLHICGLPGLC